MRKANDPPRMGRTVAATLMVFVGVGVFAAGSAQAQNTPLVLDNVEGWWDHLNCRYMIQAVNAVAGLDSTDTPPGHAVFDDDETYTPGTDGDNDSEREWCHMWDGLGTNQQRALNAAAQQSRADGGIVTRASDRVFDMRGWWNGMTDEGRLIAIGGVDADVPNGADGEFINLTVSVSNRATAAYNSLMSGMMTTEEDEAEAPALPLVGIGLLGLLLAGRGAWLRRRRA